MARGVKRGVGTMPASAGCTSIGAAAFRGRPGCKASRMAHLEDSRQAPWETAIVRPERNSPRLLRRLTWRETAFMGALAAVAGGLAIALRRRGPVARQPRALPSFAPADRTLAAASPAVLRATPQRRLYAGRDLARAVSIEDLRAMAHRRLPRFALEYLEGG